MTVDVDFRSVIKYPNGATATTTIERLVRRGMFAARSFVRYEVHDKSGERVWERIEPVSAARQSTDMRQIASREQERIAKENQS